MKLLTIDADRLHWINMTGGSLQWINDVDLVNAIVSPTEELRNNAIKIDAAYQDGYEQGYDQAKLDYERPKSKWILIDEELSRYQCPKCGEIIRLYKKNEISYLDHDQTLDDYPFSHCGLDMRGGE